jgi:hypothetical protein
MLILLVVLNILVWNGQTIAAFAPPQPDAGAAINGWVGAPAAQITATPVPTVTPTPGPPPLLGGEPAPRLSGEMVMRTYSIDFYRLKGAIDAEVIRAMALEVENTITNGMGEIGAGLTGRVSVRFEPPQTGPCAIRGLTLSNERTIRLFYAPGTDVKRIIAILAHEFFHQLQHDYYGETFHRRSDRILLEGMATWGSRNYFREPDGSYSYRARVMEALRTNTLLPLTTSLDRDCRTTTRNNIYNQWASFVEFLLAEYGREKLNAVYKDSTGREAGSANYRGIYGKSLEALEREWVDWLKRKVYQ